LKSCKQNSEVKTLPGQSRNLRMSIWGQCEGVWWCGLSDFVWGPHVSKMWLTVE